MACNINSSNSKKGKGSSKLAKKKSIKSNPKSGSKYSKYDGQNDKGRWGKIMIVRSVMAMARR